MTLYVKNNKFYYELENLCRIFFKNEKIEVTEYDEGIKKSPYIYVEVKNDDTNMVSIIEADINGDFIVKEATIDEDEKEQERQICIIVFNILCSITKQKPDWGILTGIRPVKLMRKLIYETSVNDAKLYFKEKFLVSDEKIELCCDIAARQDKIIKFSNPRSFSLYISIPFCPTRCSYCSFVSQSIEKALSLIPGYIELLLEEIDYTSTIVNKLNLNLETVYIGGGTPTSLTEGQLRSVIERINLRFDMKRCREFTVEAGRPDTITEEKLRTLKQLGVNRISINPQTLNDNVLKIIGREHTSNQTIEAFNMARKCGFDNINMDLIAGLPTEEYTSFINTIDEICDLSPENITVHTLSLKRSSRLNQEGNGECVSRPEAIQKMVYYAADKLRKEGYKPYYLYRQSKMISNLENIGFTKSGYENLYNIYMMEEIHTILSCGASGVTKLKDPYGDTIERIFNFKFPYEYMGRFPEIIRKKDKVLIFYDKFLR